MIVTGVSLKAFSSTFAIMSEDTQKGASGEERGKLELITFVRNFKAYQSICSNVFIYTTIYTKSHSDTQNIDLYTETHSRQQIAFQFSSSFIKAILINKLDIQTISNFMLNLMLLLTFYSFQQYLLFGVTRWYQLLVKERVHE